MSVIRSLEVVRISEVENVLVKSIRSTWFVRYIEVVHSLEGPLLEVPLYFNFATEHGT